MAVPEGTTMDNAIDATTGVVGGATSIGEMVDVDVQQHSWKRRFFVIAVAGAPKVWHSAKEQ